MFFRNFRIDNMKNSVFEYFDDEWMLISAGTPDNYNMMTASWGGMGFMWGRPVFFVVIRKNRYTRTFLEKNKVFTCSYYGFEYMKALEICGTTTGRNTNKAKKAGLTVEAVPGYDTVTFKEARSTFVCRKILHQNLETSCFDNQEILEKFYTDEDAHVLFIGSIEMIGD